MSLIDRDRRVIWHPFTQALRSEAPLPIVRAEREFLYDENGNQYIDAISSWWVNLHGHAHPSISQKVSEQLASLHQVIFAGCTHPGAVELAENLLKLLPGDLSKIFYSDDGSTSVEVALKMALQFFFNQGEKRPKIVALEGAYHGDTFGAMSVGARSAFSAPFNQYLFDVISIPLPLGRTELERGLEQIGTLLKSKEIAAFIYEPLIQGAGGMNIYRPEYLDPLLAEIREFGALLIADEVMTGFGRTGKLFASEYLQNKPDIICLSKGISGGTLPLGVTACSEKIHAAFVSKDRFKTFFHGHSYTANALSCAAALASLEILTSAECLERIESISEAQRNFAKTLQSNPKVLNAQSLGTILRFEVKSVGPTSYFNNLRDSLYRSFIGQGVLLRPLGNVIYVMPPYCVSSTSLEKIYQVIEGTLGHQT